MNDMESAETIKKTISRMEKTIASLVSNLAKIRSGRAHVGLLDSVSVNCYGVAMPLAQLAAVSIADSRTLIVSVWDQQNVSAVEKAIRDSNLGCNSAVAGQNIRVTLPLLSEERRCDLVKVVGKEAEDTRVAIRNIRRDALVEIKTSVKEKQLGEDEGRRLEQEIQKTTDAKIGQVDTLITDKQKELMTL